MNNAAIEKKYIKLSDGESNVIIDCFNQRIKIISLTGKLQELLDKLDFDIEKYTLEKLFCVTNKEKLQTFKDHNFIIEAKINGLLRGKDGYFLSRFLTGERKMNMHIPEEEEALITAREYLQERFSYDIEDKYIIRTGDKKDADDLSRLYDSVFETYPTPMNKADYIKYAMDSNTLFKVAIHKGCIISAASADMDKKNLNAEITDCATDHNHRQEGLMGRLIYELEKEMKKINYKVLYSIARSISPGINIVFAKHGYEYGGRLVNHCHICGQFENMNIWLKNL
jgi:putative beta-lysine N-acetyltransferase